MRCGFYYLTDVRVISLFRRQIINVGITQLLPFTYFYGVVRSRVPQITITGNDPKFQATVTEVGDHVFYSANGAAAFVAG